MNAKIVLIVSVCLAVIAAAVAAIMVSINRAAEAKAYAEAEAATADAAAAEARKAAAEKSTAIEKRRAAEAEENAKTAEQKTQKLAKETAELEARTAADNKAAAEADAKAEQAKADAARAARDEARAKAEQARSEEQKARHLAKAEESKTAAEKTKAEKTLAEHEVLKLRKINFDTAERRLIEWEAQLVEIKRDLDEQRKALEPEKTIADLAWAGGVEDSIIDEHGNLTNAVKTVYDPENDRTLPSETRRLARIDRLVREKAAVLAGETREQVIKSLEAMYVQAIREDRVIDADYYKKSILAMYPDWKFRGEGALTNATAKAENGKQ